MRGWAGRVVLIAICVFLPAMAEAATASGTMNDAVRSAVSQLQLGVGVLHQDYVEFDRGGAVPTPWLDRERGTVPTVEAGASLLWPGRVYSKLHLSWAWGDTDYDGYKQPLGGGSSLLPYATTTSNNVLDARASMGYLFTLTPWLSVAPQVEGGYSYWRRKVNGRKGVISVTENYSAYRYALGGEVHAAATQRLVFMLAGYWGQQHAEIDADVLRGSLGTNAWTRIVAGVDYRLVERWHVGFSASRVHYHYSRSRTAESGFFEPPGKTTTWRFMMRVGWALF